MSCLGNRPLVGQDHQPPHCPLPRKGKWTLCGPVCFFRPAGLSSAWSSLWILALGAIWWRGQDGEGRRRVPLSGTDIRPGDGRGEEGGQSPRRMKDTSTKRDPSSPRLSGLPLCKTAEQPGASTPWAHKCPSAGSRGGPYPSGARAGPQRLDPNPAHRQAYTDGIETRMGVHVEYHRGLLSLPPQPGGK